MKKVSGKGLWLIGALALCIFSLFLGTFFGSTSTSVADALRSLVQNDRASAAYRILMYVRLPRVFGATLAGSALAVSGAIIQSALGNPMASPNIIGVNSGAGFAVSLVVSIAPMALWAMPIAAFFGALSACLLIWLIAAKTGVNRVTITLIGVAVSSIFSAGINAVKTVFPESLYNTSTFLIGGLSGVGYERLLPAGVLIIFALAAAFICARHIDVLSMGEETAASLGMPVKAFRFVLLVLASILAGSAVSFAGLLGFVGLLVPHISRRIIGSKNRLLLPFCAFSGASLVLLCDLLGRVLFAPYELPVGILLSFIGGPFFIAQIMGQRRRTL